MIDHLSYSSISGYLQCARHWKFRYVDKEESPKNDALLFGSAWHKMIGLVVGGGRIGDAMATAFNEIVGDDDSFPIDLDVLAARMISVPAIETEILNLKPSQIEYQFELHVPGVPVPMIGFIDMITQDGHVIDFKTASRKWTQDRADNDLQPTFYLAALNQLGLVELPAQFRYMVFTKTRNPEVQILDTTRTAQDVLALYSLIKEVWQAIEAGIYVPNGVGNWKCSSNYCEFWNLCEGGKK